MKTITTLLKTKPHSSSQNCHLSLLKEYFASMQLKKQMALLFSGILVLILVPFNAYANDTSDDCNSITVVNCSPYLNIKSCSYNGSDYSTLVAHTAKTISKGGSNSATFGCDDAECNITASDGLFGSCIGSDDNDGDDHGTTMYKNSVCNTTLYALIELGYHDGYGLEEGSTEGSTYTWWAWSESGCPSTTNCEESCTQSNY